ncbi:MAG: hypothetical protein ACYC3I_01315 [Gemmataceae bacterium]
MSRSTLAAGIRYLRDKLAAHEHSEDSDEQLLIAFAVASRRSERTHPAIIWVSRDAQRSALPSRCALPSRSAARRG